MSATNSLLIADDDPLVRATYKYCLKEAGYAVATVNDGREAIAYLEKNAVHAVLLDVFMPEKDGLETLIEIKRRFPATRVVVMTGGGMRSRYDFLNAALKFGADGIVKKPVSPKILIEMLQAGVFPFTAC